MRWLAAVPIFWILLMDLSCAHLSFEPGPLATIMKSESSVSKRAPATLNSATCFSERLKNSNFQDLRRGDKESVMFATFRHQIEADAHASVRPAFESCSSVLCFYEKVYGSQNPAANLATLFFIKTGIALAVSTQVPGITQSKAMPNLQLKDFLFSTEEIKTLLEAFEALISPRSEILRLISLRRVYRLPDLDLKDFTKNGLGDACGYTNGRFVVLKADCLRASWHEDRIETSTGPGKTSHAQGFLTLFHEIAHAIDFNLLNPTQFSNQSEWLALNQTSPFVSTYAATDPREDFAETFAYFRFRPDFTRQKVAKKFEFIKNKIFQGWDYTELSRLEVYSRQVNSKLVTDLKSILESCRGKSSKGSKTSLYQLPFLSPGESICFEQTAFAYAREALIEFRSQDPEGCRYKPESWLRAVLSPYAQVISESFGTWDQNQHLFEIRRELEENFDPREVFLNVRRNDQPEKSYKKYILDHFAQFRDKIKMVSPQFVETEELLYLARHNYEVVSTEIENKINSWIEESNLMDEKANLAFDTCRARSKSLVLPNFYRREFRPALSESFLACSHQVLKTEWQRSGAQFQQKKGQLKFSVRLMNLVDDLAFKKLKSRLNQRIAQELDLGERSLGPPMEVHLNELLRPLNSKSFLTLLVNQPPSERLNVCQGMVRKSLYEKVFLSSSLAKFLTYSPALLEAEEAFCRTHVPSN